MTSQNTKICSCCNLEKPRTKFVPRRRRRFQLLIIKPTKYTARCIDCLRQQRRNYYQQNKESLLQYRREYPARRKALLEEVRVAEIRKKKALEKNKRRKFTEEKAMPTWLSPEDRQKIKDIYKNCPPGYEVDHIYPINGKNSCGLHVPANLQYLTIAENRRKSNKDPEEWISQSSREQKNCA
jgi:hypothetical protein